VATLDPDQARVLRVLRYWFGDLQYLLASLDAATLISRAEAALADAVRACARGNALEGAKVLAGALTRAV
jgi:hypothetical protein